MTRTEAVMFMILLISFGPLFAICSNPGYILKEANYIPRNYNEYLEMNKHLQCKNNDQKVVYLLDSSKEKTLVGCFREEFIFGKYCPEYNTGYGGIAQPSFKASCANFTVTPCHSPYNLSESYLYFECYEKFGAISSPAKSQQEIYEMKKREEKFMRDIDDLNMTNANLEKELNLLRERYQTWNDVVLTISIAIMFVFILAIVHCLLILFLIRKFIYKESITYKDFFKSQKILIGKLFCTSTVTVSYNCEPDIGSNAERSCAVALIPVTVPEYTVSPVNPNTNGIPPPGSPELGTSPLHTTGNNNSPEMHTNQNEDPPITEEGHVDAADTNSPVSNPGPLEYPYTAPPVSNIGPPGSTESETSPLLTTRNIDNSFEMHTKQDEDPSVTEEGHVEVEIRETVDHPECPEQENAGMVVTLYQD